MSCNCNFMLWVIWCLCQGLGVS